MFNARYFCVWEKKQSHCMNIRHHVLLVEQNKYVIDFGWNAFLPIIIITKSGKCFMKSVYVRFCRPPKPCHLNHFWVLWGSPTFAKFMAKPHLVLVCVFSVCSQRGKLPHYSGYFGVVGKKRHISWPPSNIYDTNGLQYGKQWYYMLQHFTYCFSSKSNVCANAFVVLAFTAAVHSHRRVHDKKFSIASASISHRMFSNQTIA